jgi:hypothetical protein
VKQELRDVVERRERSENKESGPKHSTNKASCRPSTNHASREKAVVDRNDKRDGRGPGSPASLKRKRTSEASAFDGYGEMTDYAPGAGDVLPQQCVAALYS